MVDCRTPEGISCVIGCEGGRGSHVEWQAKFFIRCIISLCLPSSCVVHCIFVVFIVLRGNTFEHECNTAPLILH